MRMIEGYENLYAVTSCGKVWSFRKNCFLKPRIKKAGYHMVQLNKDGTEKEYLIHRLVANTYIDNPRQLNEINHIDGNKSNNNINNLDWCTHRENCRHRSTLKES